jgi:hypothetical protein
MKVTPDSEAPIIPYATTNHGETLLPIKNDWLSAFLAVNQVTANSIIVYIRKMPKIRSGDIKSVLLRKDSKKNGSQKIPSPYLNKE